jgi:hypothetical protein
VGLGGKQTAQLQPDKWKRGTIHTPRKREDGTHLVTVDMTGLDQDPVWQYITVKEGDGFKVDWVASNELGKRRQREKLVKDWGLADASLEVKVLKTVQSGDWTKMTIQVTNRSAAFLSYWSVSAAVYDATGTFLANQETNDANLRPQASALDDILLQNVNAANIASWKLSLGRITAKRDTGDQLLDAEQFFTLQEVK